MSDQADSISEPLNSWLSRWEQPEIHAAERRTLLAELNQFSETERFDLERYLGTERLLTHYSPLSRSFCPDPETLAGYAEERIQRQLAAKCSSHLEHCPLCISDLADCRALMLESPLELVLRFGKELVEVVQNSFGELLAPAPAPVFRGQESGAEVLIERTLGDRSLRLAIRPDGEARLMLRVDLRRADQTLDFTTLLFREGAVIDGRSSESGALAIEQLEPGSYELVVREQPGLAGLVVNESVLLRLEP